MIKSIVQKVMIKEFSKYINGIQYNKLTIEVLGGHFSIQNISLNHAYFNQLETPFKISFSHIGKLSVEAPLTKLSSVPVSCTIEDVYVICELKKQGKHGGDVSKEQLLRKYIDETFKVLTSKVKDANKQQGMMDKLGKKVVDNLKMQINNIHVRFEGGNQKFTYGFGMSLKSLAFKTTDKNWVPVFIEREKTQAEQTIYKCMTIQNFKIYWQSIPLRQANDLLFLRRVNNADKIEGMKRYVTNDTDSIFNLSSVLKMKINPVGAVNRPLYEVEVNLEPIDIAFSREKIVQFLDFTSSCIKYNEIMVKTLMEKAMKKVSKDEENKYKEVCIRYVQLVLNKQATRDKNEEKKFKELLQVASIESMYDWSMQPIKEKVQLQREVQLKKQKQGWFSSKEVPLTVEQKKEVERLLTELMEDSSSKGRPPESMLFALSLNIKGLSFSFFNDSSSNLLKGISLRIEDILCVVEKSHNQSYLAVSNKVKRIVADLTIEQNKETSRIQLMENIDTGEGQYLLQAVYKERMQIGNASKINKFVDLALRKTVFIYKKEYWKMFNSFFELPEIDQQVQNQALGKLKMLKNDNQGESRSKQKEVQTSYSVEANLNSPSFILPLTATTCWFLDLGTIAMKSQTEQMQTVYPFKLTQLNMRYIDLKTVPLSSRAVLSAANFFPIIKDINFEVNVGTSRGSANVSVDIVLDKIELSATRKQLVHLMDMKKFMIGEEKDQVESHREQVRAKEEINRKARIEGRVLKRNKYFQNWSELYCVLSSNALYFYADQKELVAESVVALRGAVVQAAKLERSKRDQFVLQIALQDELTYLQFDDGEQLGRWERQIVKNINELKDLQSLILDESELQFNGKAKQKSGLFNVRLRLNEINWNHLRDNGDIFMKISLRDLTLKVVESEATVNTSFHIGEMRLFDEVFHYENKAYQHLLLGQGISLQILKNKQQKTNVSPMLVKLGFRSLDVNWKPDVLLIIIQTVKEFREIQPSNSALGISRVQVINNVRQDVHFNSNIQRYDQEGSNNSIKSNRNEYLQMNAAVDEIYIRTETRVETLKVVFIHRQSHMPMFLLNCRSLSTKAEISKNQKILEGTLDQIEVYEISGYPQTTYDIAYNYEPFCLLSKKTSAQDKPLVEFKYSEYSPQQIANKQRVNAFLNLSFSPVTVHYFQEISLRLIDYMQIQIMLLLTHSEVITANEGIVQQLIAGSSERKERPINFLEGELEEVVKRLFSPFFMDYQIVFEQPELILQAVKHDQHYFIADMEQITVQNQQLRVSRRFDRVKYEFADKMYEEYIFINGRNMNISFVSREVVTRLTKYPFSCMVSLNRLLFEDEINEITPDIVGYDRGLKINHQISSINMPVLSKLVYEQLIRLPNFNLNFEDQNGQLFIHNYRITKLLSPKPLSYELKIDRISFTAVNSFGPDLQLKLFELQMKQFKFIMSRDSKLNSVMDINLSSALVNVYEYKDFSGRTEPKEKSLVRINQEKRSGQCYFIIKIPNTTKMEVQICMESCEIELDLGIMPLIGEWMMVSDSAFPTVKKLDRQMNVIVAMPRVKVCFSDRQLQNQKLIMIGQLTVELTRFSGQSQNQLRRRYSAKEIDQDYIEELRQFMAVKVNVGFQFFSWFKGKERKLLEQVKIEFTEQDYYKVRSGLFRKTQRQQLSLANLKGNLSVDDFILGKGVVDVIEQGQLYNKDYRQKIREALVVNEDNSNREDESILDELQFRIEQVKCFFNLQQNNELIPVIRINFDKFQLMKFVNKGNAIYNGELLLQLSYFNDRIFRWEPIVEQNIVRANLIDNVDMHNILEVEIVRPMYVNFSTEMAVSIKKSLNIVNEKLKLYEEGSYLPEETEQYVSRYIMRNETGYPLQIFDQKHVSKFIIMDKEKIRYVSNRLISNLYDDKEQKQYFSFVLLHSSIPLLQIEAIALDSEKSFTIELLTEKGVKLPDHCQLYLDVQIEGSKKILTIRSKKYINDYSENVFRRTYYPFDRDQSIVLTDRLHKGIKANFYSSLRTQRFIYNGYRGVLTIRRADLVYNYTLIPLNVCDYVVMPGEFVGINAELTIQGMPYRQSFLKVYYNDKKHEYYIYSISYIMDYTGLNYEFDDMMEIKQLYQYSFKEKGRKVTIYLLPDINFDFTVSLARNSKMKSLSGKLARQMFSLESSSHTYTYSCYSYLESFCRSAIKQFRKVIEITNSHIICNQTTETIAYRQVDSVENDKSILKPQANRPFLWNSKSLRELFCVSIAAQGEQWCYSAPLSIAKSIETFTIRNQKQPSIYKIYELWIEETNNITFIHIMNADQKCIIRNDLPDASIGLYQQALFSKNNEQYIKGIDPSNFVYHVPAKSEKGFGLELPAQDHRLCAYIELTPKEGQKALTFDFVIPNLQHTTSDQTVQITSKGKVSGRISYCISFSNKSKVIHFFIKRREIFPKKQSIVRAKLKLKALYLSMMGLHDSLRKQLLNISLHSVDFSFYLSKQFTEMKLEIKNMRIQNTLRAQPYFIALFSQTELKKAPALSFILKRSRENPHLITYVGFQMKRSILSLTSEQLEILQENFNTVMQRLKEKSDTDFQVLMESKFTPGQKQIDDKLYFKQAEIMPIRLVITYKHVNNWGGPLLKALSINDCKVKVDGKKIYNFQTDSLIDFFGAVGSHFKEGLESQIFSMIGSLAVLGSPINLANKIGCGFQNLINLPADGFEQDGVLGIGKGLALGTGSLLSNTVEGAFGSVESITGTIGNGISGLASYDKNFERNRQEIKNQRVEHVGEGLMSGGKSIFNGVFTGITGLVTQPIKGASQDGIGGFLLGGLKGITGLIVKPISGVIDATSKTAEGIKNTTKVFSQQARQLRTRRYDPRPFYCSYREFRTYDLFLSQVNRELGLMNSKYQSLSWCGLFQLKNGSLFIVTFEYLLLMGIQSFEVEQQLESAHLISLAMEKGKIVIVAKNDENERIRRQIDCKQTAKCMGELKMLFNYYNSNYGYRTEKRTPK